jgi:hypothetical protein
MILGSNGSQDDAILSALIDERYFEDECDKYSVDRGDGSKRNLAVCKSKFDDAVKLVCTLPAVTKNIYVTVTEGDAKIVRRVLAVLEDFERDDAVRLGNVLLVDDPDLRANHICGVILLPGNVFNVLDHLPGKLTIDSVEYQFIAVVFLTNEENEIRRTRGHDALMDYWTEIDKDLISFGVSKGTAE